MSEQHRQDRQNHDWQVQPRSGVMTRRFDFADYGATRGFLERLTRLSDTCGYFPNLNFSSTHVTVSVAAQGEALGPTEYAFAGQVDRLAEAEAMSS